MRNIMNNSSRVVGELDMRLIELWFIEVDRSYKIEHGNNQHADNGNVKRYIAIRTAAGEGAVEFTDGRVFTLPENSFFLFRSAIKCHYCTADKWVAHFYSFETGIDLSDKMNHVRELGISEHERRMSDECFTYLDGTSDYEALYAQYQFKSLFALWHVKYKPPVLFKKNLENVLGYIARNSKSNIKISDLSAILDVSDDHLRVIFKKHIGMSPKQYINEKRLKIAMEMLETTSMTLKEIASACGFCDQYYFSNCFKTKYGIAPSKVRRSRRYNSSQ